jgi:general transcription factor 3C polypeptide 5 (transcription factor C subunit 1)
VVTSVVDEETGEEKKRMINRMRWKGYGPAAIMFTDTEVLLMLIGPFLVGYNVF